MNVKLSIAAGFAGLVLMFSSGAVAQQQKYSAFFEAYPRDLALKLKEKDKELGQQIDPGKVTKGVAAGLKVWHDTEQIRVCFFVGASGAKLDDYARKQLARIVNAAKLWGMTNAHVPLHFGKAPNYRNCRDATGKKLNHIRVGFSGNTYWSLVGKDSINGQLRLQKNRSMNLPFFLIEPPPDKEFRRAVLHEFGHALGFEHEHRHPFSTCEEEFNWPVIIEEIAEPNSWTDKDVMGHKALYGK